MHGFLRLKMQKFSLHIIMNANVSVKMPRVGWKRKREGINEQHQSFSPGPAEAWISRLIVGSSWPQYLWNPSGRTWFKVGFLGWFLSCFSMSLFCASSREPKYLTSLSFRTERLFSSVNFNTDPLQHLADRSSRCSIECDPKVKVKLDLQEISRTLTLR